MKFKTAQQGAQDYGRIDAYLDIEAVELACDHGFNFGKFYMITNSKPYVRKSARGAGTVFCMHDGWRSQQGLTLHCPDSKGREHVKVVLTLDRVAAFLKSLPNPSPARRSAGS